MQIGERVRHLNRDDLGIGELVKIYSDGDCKAVFPGATFDGIPLGTLVSAEIEYRAAKQQAFEETVLRLLDECDYENAEALYERECKWWWAREEFEVVVQEAKKEEERRAHEQKARELAKARARIKAQVCRLLEDGGYEQADHLYRTECGAWWSPTEYQLVKEKARFLQRFVETFRHSSVAALDALHRNRPDSVNLSSNDVVALKLPKVRKHLAALGLTLQKEQLVAIARPERRILVTARAGSGKTRTLCARCGATINLRAARQSR